MCEKSSTWYEEERSRILYTCEEKYDGNMVAFVIDLESQLTGLKLEHEALMNDLKNCVCSCDYCKYARTQDVLCDEADFNCSVCRYTEECKCLNCTNEDNHWEWRGMTDQKGSKQA